MRLNKKRALIGYHPQSVLQLVEGLQAEFAAAKEQLEDELAALLGENDELALRVRELTKKVNEKRMARGTAASSPEGAPALFAKKIALVAPKEA
jgi:peptidoglycan hydrolase CwlO-like protein